MKKQTFFTKLFLSVFLATFVFSPLAGVVGYTETKEVYAQGAPLLLSSQSLSIFANASDQVTVTGGVAPYTVTPNASTHFTSTVNGATIIFTHTGTPTVTPETFVVGDSSAPVRQVTIEVSAKAQGIIDAVDDAANVKYDEFTEIDVLKNDTGPIDYRTGEITLQPTNGEVVFNIDKKTISFKTKSDHGQYANHTFTYKICDSTKTNCDEATVKVTASEDGGVDPGPSPQTQGDEEEIDSPCKAGLEIVACSIGVLLIRIVWFGGTQVIASLVGGAMDFFLYYTGQSSTYKNIDFILVGWGIVRDISNIILIAGLVFIAINMMLSSGGAWKKSLSQLIVVALLINFSLFFTQVIVDASHILARVFYNSISTSSEKAEKVKFMGHKYLAVSEILINKMNPQRFLSGEIREKYNAMNAENLQYRAHAFYFTLFIVMGCINVLIIGAFASILFLMIGRTIQLMFSMIGAPFAFASMVIPQLKGTKTFGFGTWLKDLVSTAFMLPVFLFFMYLVALFIDLGDQARVANALENANLGWTDLMINILIPILLVLGLLMAAKSAAKSMASEITTTVAGAVEKATKAAIGAAAAAGFIAATAATGGATSMLGANMAKSGAASVKSGRTALAAARALPATTPAEIAARNKAMAQARSQIAAGARQKARGTRWQSFTKKQMDLRNFKIGGVGIGDFGKALGINIGQGSQDTSSAISRAKAVEEKKTKQIQDDITNGTSSIRDDIEEQKLKLKELEGGIQDSKDAIEERKKKVQEEYEEWVVQETAAGNLSGNANVVAQKKAAEKERRRLAMEADNTTQLSNGKTYVESKAEVDAVKKTISDTKLEIKNLNKELLDASRAIMESHVESMKSGFNNIATSMRDAINNGINSVSWGDISTNFASNDFINAVTAKIRASL